MSCILPDDSGIKLEIARKITETIHRLSNTHLNNQLVIEEIRQDLKIPKIK
jgi:hypothetical protein